MSFKSADNFGVEVMEVTFDATFDNNFTTQQFAQKPFQNLEIGFLS
jgi:hypothetical protein